ncbi:hypothetical protein WJX73_003978 [Symbiochloris irregularis]|uniref:Protein phosphatase methylesterase 1 n=1 Tax=Symbiochloris irregularis TaxID=706552 RepID=A0AAW1NWM9_9CHLO
MQSRPPTGARSLREQASLRSATKAMEGLTGPSGDESNEASQDPINAAKRRRSEPEVAIPPWDSFFARQVSVSLPERGGDFRVYQAGDKGPLLFCLHGGGYTGMTWAACARQLASNGYRVAAMEMRGHGETTAAPPNDLSLDTLVQDAIAVWRTLYGEERPPTVVVGHSMGGAVAVHAALSKVISPLAGIVVIDVVEGSAMAALPFMITLLDQRPKSFASLQEAIHWAASTGLCKQISTAAITVPPMLRQQPDSASVNAHDDAMQSSPTASDQDAHPGPLDPITEDAELDISRPATPMPDAVPDEAPALEGRWYWRTHLQSSQRFWEGWYRGLSNHFLSVPAPKVLVIADTNRLDTALTIGQMQGKFQQVLVPQAGHAVHEDNADQVATILTTFMKRNRVGEPPLSFPKPAALRKS